MKKRSGFTLIELLAVIVILAIILVIAIPNIIKIIDKNKLDANIKNEDMFLNAAKKYMLSNSSKVPINIGDTTEITLNELKANNFIGDIKNSYNNNSCNGYVLITKIEQDKYDYTPNLNCITNISNSTDDATEVHYKFDDFQEPTENLTNDALVLSSSIPNNGTGGTFGSWVFSTWSGLIHEVVSAEKISNSKAIKIYGNTSIAGWNDYWNIAWRDNTVIGSAYTLSFYAKGNGTIKVTNHWSGDMLTINLTEELKRYSVTFTRGGTTANYFWIRTTGLLTNQWCHLEGFQVEKKGYATPFVNGIRTGIARDYSGRGNNGNLDITSTPKWTSTSKIGGGAYEFNGTNNCVILNPSNSIIKSNTNWSLSAWFNSNTIGSYTYANRIVALMRTNASSTAAALTLGLGKVSFMYADAGANHKYLSADISTNTWYHVVGTYDGTKYTLFLNGNKINEITDTFQGFSTGTASLGCMPNGTDLFNGKIDDLKIYNRTLSADEIIQKYKMELSRSN